MKIRHSIICAVLTALALVTVASSCSSAKVKRYKVTVVKEYPHDDASYTQGLFFLNGQMYESTGQYGESTFRKVNLATGEALDQLDFSKKYFVEGSCVLNNNLYILTWQNKVAFIYDVKTLEYKQTYSYPREGWGLTTDGTQLIASDGSSTLYFMDDKFQVKKKIIVKQEGKPIRMLNELEYIDGKIWANVYMTDLILIINPDSGEVEGSIDCTGLLPKNLKDSRTDVLNGIAYNPQTKKIYLTGKYWKKLYEVKIEEKK